MTFLDRLKLSKYGLIDMSPTVKADLLSKYELLASNVMGACNKVLDPNSYSVLLNEILFLSVVAYTKQLDLVQYTNLNKMVSAGIKANNGSRTMSAFNMTYNKLVEQIKKSNIEIKELTTPEEIENTLKMYGLEEVNSDDLDIDLENIARAEELANQLDIFGEDAFTDFMNNQDEEDNWEENEEPINIFEDANESEVSTEEVLPDEEEEYNWEEDDEPIVLDMDTESQERTEEKSDEQPKEQAEENQEETTTNKERKELREKLETLFKADINNRVNIILATLEKLYKSGFESMPQSGILVSGGGSSSPLVSIRTKEEGYGAVRNLDSGSVTDLRILETITKILPEMNLYAEGVNDKEDLPAIDSLMSASAVCYKLHLKFQSANIKYCTGKNGIYTWIKETQLEKSGCTTVDDWLNKNNSGGKTRLNNWKHVASWYRWSIKNIIYDALIDAGVKPDLGSSQLEQQVLEAIYRNIKNVIVVSERNINKEKSSLIKTEIRISTDTNFNIADMISNLQSTLNVGNDTTIKVKQIGSITNNVYKFAIIFDSSEENKANLFASEVLDNILSSGNAPSWSHALLGKNEDGTYLFWDDFMNPAKAGPINRCYTIYAASRSGKGIMTSTLTASALCDKKQVLYTDGKPENGASLGEMAWAKGKEAYVFNGTASGAVPYVGELEQYSYGVRKSTNGEVKNEIYDFATHLPKALFESSIFKQSDQQKFLGVMRYLKSMMLCSEVIINRAKGILPKDQWQIWIFDEMTKMSSNEKEIRKLFLQYAGDKVKVKKVSDNDKVEYLVSIQPDEKLNKCLEKGSNTYDEGIVYISQWLKWTEYIKSNMRSAAVIELGKADINLIFIFQQASWIPNDCNITTIGAIVDALDSTKIVGRGGVEPLCKNYGDGTIKAPWLAKVNEGTGWWAISQGSDVRSCDMKVFKPFNVFTTKLGPDGTKSNEPMTDEESKHYMDGYVRALLGNFGVAPEDVLQSAYSYAEQAVTELNLGTDLKSFMYNASELSTGASDNKLEEIADGVTPSNSEFKSSVDGIDNEQPELQHQPLNFETNLEPDGVEREPETGTFAEQVERQISTEEIVRNLRFMTTSKLMDANLDDEVLGHYFDKYIFNMIQKNKFDYSDRQTRSKTGLLMASIVLSNFYYCSAIRQIYEITNYKNYLSQLITNNKDPMNKAKIALGMLNAYDDSTLQFDTMPTQDQCLDYIQTFNFITSNESSNEQETQFGWEKFFKNNEQNNEQGFTGNEQNNGQDIFNTEQNFTEGQGFSEPTSQTENTNNMFNQTQPQIDLDNMADKIFNSFIEQEYSDIHSEPKQQKRRWFFKPDEDLTETQPSYIEDDNGDIQLQPRNTQDVLFLQPNQYIATNIPKHHVVKRFRKKLFESRNGTAYEFKMIWDFVLNGIEQKYPNKSMVTRLAFTECTVTVNGESLRLNGVLGGEYDVRIDDILNIKETLKRFRMIKQLIVDATALQCLIREYGQDAQSIWTLFQENRALEELGIIPVGTKTALIFRRNTFANTANKLNELLGFEETKMQIEQFAATRNPRLKDKSPGYTHKIWKNSQSASKNLFKNAGSSVTDKNPKIMKALGFSLAGTGIIVIGGALGLGGKLIGGGKKLVSMFKA